MNEGWAPIKYSNCEYGLWVAAKVELYKYKDAVWFACETDEPDGCIGFEL